MRPHGCQGEYQPEPPHLGNAVLAWHGPLGRWEGRIPEAYPRGVENGPATWQAVVIQRKTPEQHMVMGHESIRGELDLLSLQELWQNCFGIPEKGAGCKLKRDRVPYFARLITAGEPTRVGARPEVLRQALCRATAQEAWKEVRREQIWLFCLTAKTYSPGEVGV